MANAHPNEQELYDAIQKEQIKVPFLIWDLIYRYIGDDITAITHIASLFYESNEPMDIPSAKRILNRTQRIHSTMDKILHPEKITEEERMRDLEKLKNDDMKLHPVIKELFTHYISNDVHGINMIVCYHLDPIDESPVPVENIKKILDKTRTMKQFMDRLSQTTNQKIYYIRKGSQ